MFTKNSNITIKQEISEKNNLYSGWIDFGFRKFETIDKKERSYSLKIKNKCKTMLSIA